MRVGVIIPARAPVPYLDDAVRSVLSQVPAPDDVVVVDHGSALGEVAGARVVQVEAGGGPAVAREAGLHELSTELVALADADDVWEAGKLAAQLEALERHPEAAVCFGSAVVIDAAGRETGEQLPEAGAGLHSADEFRSPLFMQNVIPAASAIVRRDALVAVGGFVPDPPLAAASDWDLWLRLAAAGFSFVCEPKARIRYRRHAGGLTADLARLAEGGLAIHERHAALVEPGVATSARAHDLEALAQARIRQRRYGEARAALAEASQIRTPSRRLQTIRAALAIPGVRAGLGRRDPYR